MQRSIRGRSGCETTPFRSASGVKAVGIVWVGRNRVAISPAEEASRVALKSPHTIAGVPSARPSIHPKPLTTLNHFTVPVSSTDGSLDMTAWKVARRGVVGTAVLLSTLSTSVTCGPLCPGPTRTSRVSPGCTALMLRASTLPWRKASPDPSDSSTNPNPFSGLNHLTTDHTTDTYRCPAGKTLQHY